MKLRKKTDNSSLKWIVKSVKPNLSLIVILTVTTAVLGCAGSCFAVIVGKLIDAAAKQHDMALFIFFAVLLAFAYALTVALSAFIKYFTARTKAKIDISLRKKLFSSVLSKDFSKISAFHSGEIMNRMTSDVSTVSDAATNLLPNFIGLIARFIFALCLVIAIQPFLALIYTLGGVAVFFVSRIFRKRIKLLHKAAQKTEDDNRSFWQECLNNLLTVKVFAAAKQIKDKSDALQGKSFEARMKSATFSALANSGYSLILSLGYVFAFIWCGVCLFYDLMTFGAMTTIIELVSQLQSPFSGLSGIFTQYYVSLASAERLIEIEQLTDEPLVEYVNANDVYKNMQSLEFNDVCFKYDRDYVLNNLDLSIKKGEFIGILGNSGIGKSTLFKLILGVYEPNSGEISFSAGDLIKCSANTRTMFAYVPQGNMMFSGSIRDNITLINSNVDNEMLKNALKICCIDEFVDSLPNGIDTELGEKGLGLSEGQAQRIALARAIVSNAPILLLDEATSALDANTEAEVLQNIRSMKDKTCIIVTHRIKALDICDRAVEIKNGQIIEKIIKN